MQAALALLPQKSATLPLHTFSHAKFDKRLASSLMQVYRLSMFSSISEQLPKVEREMSEQKANQRVLGHKEKTSCQVEFSYRAQSTASLIEDDTDQASWRENGPEHLFIVCINFLRPVGLSSQRWL